MLGQWKFTTIFYHRLAIHPHINTTRQRVTGNREDAPIFPDLFAGLLLTLCICGRSLFRSSFTFGSTGFVLGLLSQLFFITFSLFVASSVTSHVGAPYTDSSQGLVV
tara:strand:- start:943 stop:1263 length:321 start_codon:yes stop_codon:yes gene_type:complete